MRLKWTQIKNTCQNKLFKTTGLKMNQINWETKIIFEPKLN